MTCWAIYFRIVSTVPAREALLIRTCQPSMKQQFKHADAETMIGMHAQGRRQPHPRRLRRRHQVGQNEFLRCRCAMVRSVHFPNSIQGVHSGKIRGPHFGMVCAVLVTFFCNFKKFECPSIFKLSIPTFKKYTNCHCLLCPVLRCVPEPMSPRPVWARKLSFCVENNCFRIDPRPFRVSLISF